MTKIWQKNKDFHSNKIIEKYNTGEDYLFDLEIMPYDIQASAAHAKMLRKIGVLDEKEAEDVLAGLSELEQKCAAGEVAINMEDEDCHTVIENFLIVKIGEAGKKIHTGRSRNDQVLTAARLYLLTGLRDIRVMAFDLIDCFMSLAEAGQDSVLPGYTHTQQAMLSSVAHWSLSFVESLLNDIEMLEAAIRLNDQNPLGTAAGFGVDFPLDREFTAGKLGFSGLIVNSLFAQGSRGKFESFALEALSQIMLTLSRFAADMLFFTARETGFFSVGEELTTGSSIMPQKKNYDSMELMRGYASVVLSNQLTVKNLVKGAISGYNRDLQLIKKPLIESVHITQDSLAVAKEFVLGLKINEENIYRVIKKDIIAADLANELVSKEKMSFRDAYVKVGLELDKIETVDYVGYMKRKRSLGSPGNLGVEIIQQRLQELRNKI